MKNGRKSTGDIGRRICRRKKKGKKEKRREEKEKEGERK